MKPVAVTLRIDSYPKLNERRDAIDRRWVSFLQECSLFPIYIPNSIKAARLILGTIKVQGIIFSGGNTLTIFQEGDAPERDEVENFLMDWALKNYKPILGICRGMQFIQSYFGVSLQRIKNHASRDHIVKMGNNVRVVNSYHNYGTTEISQDFDVLFTAEDGIIEAISHKEIPLKAIMWHPERMEPFDHKDINFVKAIFNV